MIRLGRSSGWHAPRVVLVAATCIVLVTTGCTSSPGSAPRSDSPGPVASSAGSGTSTPVPTPTASTPAPTTTRQPGPAPQPAGGLPTAAELAKAAKDVGHLSTRGLAGQLVVARYSGTAPSSAAAQVRRLGLGGVVVFSANVPARRSDVVPTLRGVAASVTQVLQDQKRDWPAFLGVDQEGGPVSRVAAPATAFPAVMALGAARDQDLARSVGQASGSEMRALGFTVVLAPDADVTTGPADPTIGVRSAGSDPELVAEIASGLVRGYLDAGVVPVAKHFPGHGSVTTDSHVGLPRQRASLVTLEDRDLVPFARLVEERAPAIMTGHILLPALDDQRPATLSPEVTSGLLRTEMGFGGLVVTDALEMGAVTGAYGSGKAAVMAVRAGADVVLMPADPGAAVDALASAVAGGQLSRARLVQSAARIVATLRHTVRTAPAAGTVGSHQVVAKALATASVTQVSGRCGTRLVGQAISVSGAGAADRERFVEAARRAGLQTGSGTAVRLLGGGAYLAGSGSASGSEVGDGDVVVALDVPYGLAQSRARLARLAAYGRTSATFDAVVAVLLGRAAARGRLPVAVGAWKVGAGCSP